MPDNLLKYEEEVNQEISWEQNWPEMMKGIAKVGENIWGTKSKNKLAPWLDDHRKEI